VTNPGKFQADSRQLQPNQRQRVQTSGSMGVNAPVINAAHLNGHLPQEPPARTGISSSYHSALQTSNMGLDRICGKERNVYRLTAVAVTDRM
jgi:hypothetical protein